LKGQLKGSACHMHT